VVYLPEPDTDTDDDAAYDAEVEALHARGDAHHAEHGWATADTYAISDADMMRASVAHTAHLRDLLERTWERWRDPAAVVRARRGRRDHHVRQRHDDARVLVAGGALGRLRALPGREDPHAHPLRGHLGSARRRAVSALHGAAAAEFFHGMPWHDDLPDAVAGAEPDLGDVVEIARSRPWAPTDEQAFQLRWPLQRLSDNVAAAWADAHGRTVAPAPFGNMAGYWGMLL
jgi:hypothetical protein